MAKQAEDRSTKDLLAPLDVRKAQLRAAQATHRAKKAAALAGGIVEQLDVLTMAEVKAMTVEQRRKFAGLCDHWAKLAPSI